MPPKARPASSAAAVVATLRRLGTPKTRDGLARFGLPADKAFGVSVSDIRTLAKQLGPNHALAEALWATGWTDARMLACFVAEPDRVTPALMDRWCRDFDSWGICDTACFVLFDRTPHALAKVKQWARREGEFQKRAAFALLACLALHAKDADDEPFAEGLVLIERAAADERNFVKKGVSWALRAIGLRRPALKALALDLARRLAASAAPAARWVGKDALRDLTKARAAKTKG